MGKLIISADNRPMAKFPFIMASINSSSMNAPTCSNRRILLDRANSPEEAMSAKPKVIVDAMLYGNFQHVLWLDTDTILRKPVDGIWEGVEPGTFKIIYRPKCADETKFNTGVIAFGVSPEIIKFVMRWYEIARNPKRLLDEQEGFYKAYQEHKQSVKMLELPETYNDSKFRGDSVIWHGKGHHRKNKKYLKEVKKYAGFS